MPETGSLPQEMKEQQPEVIGTADVVIGVPGLQSLEDLAWATQMAGSGQRVVIAYPNSIQHVDSAQLAGPQFLQYEAPSANAPVSFFGSFQEIFQISQRVGAKCCCVWNTSPERLSSDVLDRMLEPTLSQNIDLVFPRYADMKFGALINRSIIYPAVRALYGKRISYSMAIDLCFSAQLVERLMQIDPKTRRPRSQQWIAAEAISGGAAICEVNLPMDPPRPPESLDVSSILSMVLGRLFLELERNSMLWQRSNTSPPIPVFGEATRIEEEDVAVDVQRMIETFQLGYRNLRDIWNLALPPASLLELKKIAALTPDSFRLPDDLWARIVYDFAMAHRQRTINREHLLRAMTPLYLAWVASHTLELKDASLASVQLNQERLALAYEKQKPYLLSRWRWPDRFNP